MPMFMYTAMDGTGHETKGTVEASSDQDAQRLIKELGLFPTSVAERKQVAPRRRGGASGGTPGNRGWLGQGLAGGMPRIPRKSLAVVTRQLATMIDAGMPLVRALRFLGKQATDAGTCQVVSDLASRIEEGQTFSEALAAHPRSFSNLYVNMARAGEASGSLEGVLSRQATYLEKNKRIRKKVRAALTYPISVCVIAMAITSGLMIFIVPKFAQIFREMLGNKPLPGLTRGVLAVSEFMMERTVVAGALVVAVIMVVQFARRTTVGAQVQDAALLRLPAFGPLIRASASAQFCRLLGTLLGSGVPILNALQIVGNTVSNRSVASRLSGLQDAVREGDKMSRCLAHAGVFPPMLVGMIEVGEETGALPELLERTAFAYEEEVDNAVDALTSLIEPAMIVFLAGVVGTIVVALFMPLIVLISNISM